jgi:hypothetical protein
MQAERRDRLLGDDDQATCIAESMSPKWASVAHVSGGNLMGCDNTGFENPTSGGVPVSGANTDMIAG